MRDAELPREARRADPPGTARRAPGAEPADRILGRRARIHRPGRRSARAPDQRDRREQHPMLRQFALLGMGVAILPSYLIGSDIARGALVRLLPDFRLPQVEINIAYPSRRHLPAKVRTFIDHLVEYFSRATDAVIGEQWAAQGTSSAPIGVEMRADPAESTDPNLQPRLARAPRGRAAVPSPL
ncbi:LysR substrate-binding domain-containing protein [Burkholderia vietnamiensis]|nr:LysR substrate-binding domain-containing protein [Burkholderia vietnamiensis]MEC4597270.1 LysR substrate-binding domain-containing protein [Burkholderia vietnamiensis]